MDLYNKSKAATDPQQIEIMEFETECGVDSVFHLPLGNKMIYQQSG